MRSSLVTVAVLLLAWPAAASARIASGTYVRTVKPTKATRAQQVAGRWTLTVTKGTYILDEPGADFIAAGPQPLRYSGTQVTFVDPQHRQDKTCARGTYRLARSGRTFSLRAISDKCTSRRLVLAGRWTRTS